MIAIHVNVVDSQSVQAMIVATIQAYGKLDVLVNSAGTGEIPAPIHEKTEADWNRVMAVNATGTFLCMKYALPHMLAVRSGVHESLSAQSLSTQLEWHMFFAFMWSIFRLLAN